MYSDEG